jgi:hypothetical protein
MSHQQKGHGLPQGEGGRVYCDGFVLGIRPTWTLSKMCGPT